MNAVQRFFRRYIVSTVGIVLLFLAVNIALLFAIIIAGGMSGADTSFSVRDFSDHVVLRNGKWVADDTALSMLQEQSAWAMLLNEDGDVIWQQSLPEKLPSSYTSTEIASFSRWYLEEQGELAEINAGLNRAADYMKKKDNTRAEWIRGVSHDIRTPLSMTLGYASELEDNCDLPPDARKQAGIIRRESEKIRRLIDDLNLTTKLEYALQPVHFKNVDWVEISRQAVSEVLNSGLDSRYEIVFAETQPGRSIQLGGDDRLLRRMLDNLIRNSITHNPQGCRISVSVGEENERCLCAISDDGVGIAPDRLKVLNRGDDITSTQGNDEKDEHGLGLKLVMQIVKAHRGTVSFSDNSPHGLEVRISLPIHSLIS